MRSRPHRRTPVLLAALLCALLAAPHASASLGVVSLATATTAAGAPVHDWLDQTMGTTAPADTLVVMVHGTDLAVAHAAVASAGMTHLHDLSSIGVAIASGTPAQVSTVAAQPGVTYVEGNQPIAFTGDTSHEATRGAEAIAGQTTANAPLDGSGVTVAVIDSGIDPTHPAFTNPDGSSAVIGNLKNVCALGDDDPDTCMVEFGPLVDTDLLSAGGHGTHVNGIAAGRAVTLADGETVVSGAAPGASVVSLSVGAVIAIIGANIALDWVVQHHAAPCGEGVSADVCPPIKVTNNSYGPIGGGTFNPDSATVQLQRALLDEGVMTVWAAGNDGGDGSDSRTNPPGQDPTSGILSVASYFDRNRGDRDATVSSFSSRGDETDPSTWPDLSAPGEGITSACRVYLPICASGFDFRDGPGLTDVGAYNTISGTSMAAPHIAGIIAQLFQADPDATPAEIEDALKVSANRYDNGADYTTVGEYTTSFDKGTGLVDVVAAVDYLLNPPEEE